MQFYLNGFDFGDPEILDPSKKKFNTVRAGELPDEVDVLIVGAGPAGLTLAAQLAVFPEVKTCVIDHSEKRLLLGRADGIACRTMEVFHAFGFAERVMKEAYWVNEVAFWSPDDRNNNNIIRTQKIKDTEYGLSEFPHVILSQARIHDFFLERMEKSKSGLYPYYGTGLTGLTVNRDESADYPVVSTLSCSHPKRKTVVKTIRSRYVVGCDGGHSIVRESIGRPLKGDSANKAWGVMDILAVTNFPDIRLKSIIRSARYGNLLIIPREGGYMVRFYIELEAIGYNEKAKDEKITPDDLVLVAERIMHPYSLEVKEIGWWSVYRIGQRLCDKFDDVSDDDVSTSFPRVFVAGDACHTHSPKAGQGMNVAMGDGFNLGWKLVSVLRGQCSPSILHTFSTERQSVAKELIDFDREFAKLFSTEKNKTGDNKNNVDPNKLQSYFVKHARYTAGVEIQYKPSIITGHSGFQDLATGFIIGTRFHSAPVLRMSDKKQMHLGHTVKADGRWRLFVFVGEEALEEGFSQFESLCEFLNKGEGSPLGLYTPSDADIDSVIDIRTVFQQELDLSVFENCSSILKPQKGTYDLRDYEKVFCSDIEGDDDIFEMRGINRLNGCMVLVRPDQYIGHILPLNATKDLERFFAAFMKSI